MSDFVVPPRPAPYVPVAGGGRFPVRRIFCVGRNYAEHAREMGHDPDREPPFFFGKPADAVLTGGADLAYPLATGDLHFELELVVALGQGGTAIPVSEAAGCVWGAAVGLDMTRRDLQAEAKKLGRPWDMAKGFNHSAPIGDLLPIERAGPLDRGPLTLKVNGQLRQSGDLADMIWSVPEIVAALSNLVRLAPGDLIFTGTPAGVGAVGTGDVLEGRIAGLPGVTTRIVSA